MKLLIVCAVLLHSACSTYFSYPGNSAVITSKDVREGTANTTSLEPNTLYRVYAVFTSDARNDAYARGVIIRGADNKQTNVADLAKPISDTFYELESVSLLTPITIADTNQTPVGKGPYTIYIVKTPGSSVISAQHANGTVNLQLSKISSESITILSAEKNIVLRNVTVDHPTAVLADESMSQVDILSTGYDMATAAYAPYKIMTVTRNHSRNYVLIPSPIVTLFHTNATQNHNAVFSFSLERHGNWSDVSLAPGDSTPFLSNGYLESSRSYYMDYNDDGAFSRVYDFGRNTHVTLNATVSNYYPGSGDRFECTCATAQGATIKNDCGVSGEFFSNICKSIHINVAKGTRTPTGPRFHLLVNSATII